MIQLRKLITVITILTLASVFTARAQEAGCDIDLSSIVTQLVQAQATASGGDTEAGLAQIGEVRAALAEITSGCAEAGVTPGVLLDNRFVAPNGTFTVDYPSGWVEGNFSPNPRGGAIFLGNSETAADALNAPTPQLRTGEKALVVAVGTPDLLGGEEENPSLEVLLQGFAARNLSQFAITGELEMTSLEDRTIGRMEFGGETFAAVTVGIQLEDSDLYAIVVGVTAPDELDALRPLVDAVALSVR
jgi:hypothetical protein